MEFATNLNNWDNLDVESYSGGFSIYVVFKDDNIDWTEDIDYTWHLDICDTGIYIINVCMTVPEADYDINIFGELRLALWHIAFQDDADTCDSKFILRFEDGTIKEITTKRISEETLRKKLHNTEDIVND